MKRYIKPETIAVLVDTQRFMDTLSGDSGKTITDGNQFLGREDRSDWNFGSSLWSDSDEEE